MALEEDIFEPTTPTQHKGSWVDRPGVRSALLQAGLQMLMPSQPGTSTAGNIASSLGQGGEAYRRAIGTRIAGRKQKADEVNTESLVDYRADNNAPGGKAGNTLTLSQRLKVQRDNEKDFNKWVDAQVEELVGQDETGQLTPSAARQQLLADKGKLIGAYRAQKQVAQEATGQQTLRTSQDLVNQRPELFAQLKSGLAAGDQDAIQALEVLKSRVADPEALDVLLGGLGG